MLIEELGLRNPITVGYYDPFSIFPSVKDDLELKCPLTNLHWKYHPLKPVKLIPLLPVRFVEEVPNSSSSVKLKTESTNVYLRLIFVKADNLEAYRSQVRPLIQAWLTDLVDGKEVSWAIMLMCSASQRDKSLTLMKKSIYEKLTTDFSKNGKHQVLTTQNDSIDLSQDEEEFVFRLLATYKSDLEKLETFNEIVTEFKGLILKAFDRRYNTCCDELKVLKEKSKSDPELLIKEITCRLKLVDGVSDMRFFDESLEIYEEMDDTLKVLLHSISHAFKKGDMTIFNASNRSTFDPEKSDLARALLSQLKEYLKNGTPIDLLHTELHMFLGVSILLQSLANSAPSISQSSMYILHLFQRLIGFINGLIEDSGGNHAIIEWSIALVDFYSRLPIVHVLLQLDAESEVSNVSSSAAIFEYMGELKILKRGLVGKLATTKGLELPEIGFLMEDVSLDQSNGTHTHPNITLQDETLQTVIETQESFDKFYEDLTVAAILDFANCERLKTIDLLSIDLAILNYKNGNYKQAFEVLQTSYDYFIENGWNFMGGLLLEIYIKCLEKLDFEDQSHIFETHVKLLAALKHNTRESGDINKYDIAKSRHQREKIFQDLLEISLRLPDPMTVPLDVLFGNVVQPQIEPMKGKSGTYAIELEISNYLGIELELEELSLELKELGSLSAQSIIFQNKNIKLLAQPQQVVQLHTKEFKNARFYAYKLSSRPSNNLSFIHMYQTKEESPANETVIHNEGMNDTVPEIADHLNSLGISVPETKVLLSVFYMYNDPRGFTAKFQVPKKFELNASEVELILKSGLQAIENVSIKLQSFDAGVEISKNFTAFDIPSIAADEVYYKTIPYKYFGDNKILHFGATISYFVGDDEYIYHLHNEVNSNLMILITVQDVFRSSSIYSKFQIGCSQSKLPIRILDLDFRCNNDKYNISSLSCDISEQNSQVVFGEQPAFMFYAIEPKLGKVSSSDTLDLTIKYSSLQNECESTIESLQKELFESFELLQYSTLFSELVTLILFDLNEYAINNEIRIKNADNIKTLFQNSIEAHVKSEKDRAELICCVNEILFKPIPVERISLAEQELYIPVAVPILDILHRVEFDYNKKSQHLVGEPIEMKLRILSSAQWSDSEESPDVLASSSPTRKAPQKLQMFLFTVHHEDNWLLSGSKKHAFPILGRSNEAEFDLTLIPLNVGKLPLPRVTIKPLEQEGAVERAPSTDTVHENGLETVLVVPELQSITFTF